MSHEQAEALCVVVYCLILGLNTGSCCCCLNNKISLHSQDSSQTVCQMCFRHPFLFTPFNILCPVKILHRMRDYAEDGDAAALVVVFCCFRVVCVCVVLAARRGKGQVKVIGEKKERKAAENRIEVWGHSDLVTTFDVSLMPPPIIRLPVCVWIDESHTHKSLRG